MKKRIYLDTSVIRGYYDVEFSRWSIALFERFERSEDIAVISQLTRKELEDASESVAGLLERLPEEGYEFVETSDEALDLASLYIREGIIGEQHEADALHIALATVERVELLVSWNFRHIVNLERIHGFNAVNLKSGYNILEIRSPRDVVHEEEERI